MSNYDLVDYQGNSIIIPDDKARKIAEISGLIEVEVNGKTHFINKSDIAKIVPSRHQTYEVNDKQIESGAHPTRKQLLEQDGY